MGVYIKGAEIPCDCLECMVAQFCKEYEEDDKRPYDCPLVEVKAPHGRLIDADKQFKGLQKQVIALYSEKSDKYSYLMDILDSINREPTVIEAEVE